MRKVEAVTLALLCLPPLSLAVWKLLLFIGLPGWLAAVLFPIALPVALFMPVIANAAAARLVFFKTRLTSRPGFHPWWAARFHAAFAAGLCWLPWLETEIRWLGWVWVLFAALNFLSAAVLACRRPRIASPAA